MKIFENSKLQIITHNNEMNKDYTLSLNDLTEDASDEEILKMKEALVPIFEDPITKISSVTRYIYQ